MNETGARHVVYVIGALPKVSETFVVGEIAEMVRQGERVSVFSLRHPRASAPPLPELSPVLARTTYLPHGRTAAAPLLAAAGMTVLRRPSRAAKALGRALIWAVARRSPVEALRFAQAAWIAQRLPAADVHLHAHFADGPTTVAALAAELSGMPFSFTAHARDIFCRTRGRELADKVHAAHHVVAISEHGRARLLAAAAPRDAHKLVIVRNGIDLATFDTDRRQRARPPQVLAVSRLVEKKGLDTLLDAVALLREDGVALTVLLVGDGPLRRPLQEQACRLGIEGTVRFAGSLPPQDVAAAYRQASVVALPCRVGRDGDQDGLPVTLVEAMASGVPVVSTPVAGIPELVLDGETGLLVPPGDPQGLAAALRRLLDDPRLRERLAAAARRHVSTYDRMQTVAALRRLIGAPSETMDREDLPWPA